MDGAPVRAGWERGLWLVANARMPSQRAQSVQLAQVAAAFCRARVPTVLAHARRRGTPPVEDVGALFAHYGVDPLAVPGLRAVPCIDWIERLPTRLQYLPARLQELTFARNAARLVLREAAGAALLTRELEVGRHLVRAGRRDVFLELHRVPEGRLRQRWLADACAGVAGILAISGGVREDLLALGVPAALVRVEHDAWDPGRFAERPTRAAARARLGLDAQAPLVVYTGGLLAWKGVDVLVDAARLLPTVRFLVAGGMDRDVERLRVAAGDLANVRLLGFRPPAEVPLHLAAADVVVAPNRSTPAISARYTSPLKVFECMAAGRALVASDLPSLRELLRHGDDAWLVPPDDPIALAGGIERLLADRDLCERLAATLAARAPEHTWDARAQRILAWMEERRAPRTDPVGAARADR